LTERKVTVLNSIDEQGKLTDELRADRNIRRCSRFIYFTRTLRCTRINIHSQNTAIF
jgi:hypothetical protein